MKLKMMFFMQGTMRIQTNANIQYVTNGDMHRLWCVP